MSPDTTAAFLAELLEEQEKLTVKIAALEQKLRTAEERKDQIEDAIEAVGRLAHQPLVGVVGTTAGPSPRPALDSATSVVSAVVGGSIAPTSSISVNQVWIPKNLPEAAHRTLTAERRPLHVKELIAKMQAEGVYADKPFEEVRATLVSTLDRKVKNRDTFSKPAPGTYGLRAWDAPITEGPK